MEEVTVNQMAQAMGRMTNASIMMAGQVKNIIAYIAARCVPQMHVKMLPLQLLHDFMGRYRGHIGCRSSSNNRLIPGLATQIILH